MYHHKNWNYRGNLNMKSSAAQYYVLCKALSAGLTITRDYLWSGIPTEIMYSPTKLGHTSCWLHWGHQIWFAFGTGCDLKVSDISWVYILQIVTSHFLLHYLPSNLIILDNHESKCCSLICLFIYNNNVTWFTIFMLTNKLNEGGGDSMAVLASFACNSATNWTTAVC